MQTINNKILSIVQGHGSGWVFSPNDFMGEFNRKQIDNALSDLATEGKIRRICRGLYDYHKYSELLGQQLSPDHDQVAQAFARKFNWRILKGCSRRYAIFSIRPRLESLIPALRVDRTSCFWRRHQIEASNR